MTYIYEEIIKGRNPIEIVDRGKIASNSDKAIVKASTFYITYVRYPKNSLNKQ